MDFPAHIKYENNIKITQTMKQHSENVAKYCFESLQDISLGEMGYLCGVFHDLGKYTQKYKSYIEKAARGEKVVRGSVNHTFAGVIFVLERYHKGDQFDNLCAELIAYTIGAHHGEFDLIDINGKSGFNHRLNKNRDELCYNEAVEKFLVDFNLDDLDYSFEKAKEELKKIAFSLKKISDNESQLFFYFGMLARLLLSALIDADRLDTAEFMQDLDLSEKSVDKNYWEDNLCFFDEKIKGLNSNSPINKARKRISDICFEKSKCLDGIYKINVPTGGGKTLSTLRFTLSHNLERDKKKAIFIIPLLSVLEQNRAVISSYIKEKSDLLEHHSNIINDGKTQDELDERELLIESWNKPFVISTLVQLLNILFSSKTSAIRRMKSLISSTIVIDEIQSLPIKTISMFNLAMNFLSTICKTTIVLSSATQPSFDKTKHSILFAKNADIVPQDSELFKPFERVKVIDKWRKHGYSLDEIDDFTEELCDSKKSILIICNKKATALQLFLKIKRMENRGWKVVHLSTSMCQKHREKTLETINQYLENNMKIICISTQLVEAGIDFSFECVIRILAGMDNIAQAAGRCNRNGEFNRLCEVYIMNLNEEKLTYLKDIEIAQNSSMTLLVNYRKNPENYDNNLLSEKAINTYYNSFFNTKDIENKMQYIANGMTLYELLSDNKSHRNLNYDKDKFKFGQAFKTANSLFKVFDDDTVDIVVPFGKGEQIVEELSSEKARDYHNYMRIIEKSKPYTISVFNYVLKKLEENQMVYLDINKYVYILNKAYYSDEHGLNFEGNLILGGSFYEVC